MKVLKNIKLNQFSKAELENREMNALKGGADCYACVCGCSGSGHAYSATPVETSANTTTGSNATA